MEVADAAEVAEWRVAGERTPGGGIAEVCGIVEADVGLDRPAGAAVVPRKFAETASMA